MSDEQIQYTLGERLRMRREALGFSLEDIAQEVQGSAVFLHALEENNYKIFSAKVYAQGFFTKVVRVLQCENREHLIKEFQQEWDVHYAHNAQPPRVVGARRDIKVFVTPRRIGLYAGAFILCAFLIFVATRFTRFVGTPALSVQEPQQEEIVHQPMVHVKGVVERESRLTVNDRELTIDQTGNFDDSVALLAGLNVLEFKVQNKFGKESKEVRYVLVQ